MDERPEARPLSILARDLFVATALAVALYVLFGVVNARFFTGLSGTEVVLLEAGAVVLVAFLVARAVTNATSAVLARHGLVPRGHTVRLVINALIATGAVLALFRLAGVSVESVFIGAGVAGIVIGLAAQTVLSNVFAGILIVFADPFRPGDRIGVVWTQYPLIAATYPHEEKMPIYTGTVEDVGLTYTVLRLDGGELAKLPNGIAIFALIVLSGASTVHRVRMTFRLDVPVATVEAALPAVAAAFPAPFVGAPAPRLEATDISATTWDGVVVLWSELRDPGVVRDRVVRAVLARLAPPVAPAAAPR